ncbi:maleylacetate reductase [Pseudomonas fluorescens]|uniref:Maleylacetate reductase n=1 Tax=Pseudomonas fluorescens TaxID=294 RepID=A0A379IF84_PSEFL|nr:maleylacetate reductase [Pseudomonas fluorescens]SUD31462.1 maleylacetate reductase [Pseudomonas fluorescens]
MNHSFIYNSLPFKVVFGRPAADVLPEVVQELGYKRVLVLCTPEQRVQAEAFAKVLGAFGVGICDLATMHVPVEKVADAAEQAKLLRADCTLAIGGGSTIGLAKALSLKMALPSIAIPTTYAGSEMTPVWGLTENGRKTTGKDPAVQPKAVIYDPELTLSLPVDMSVTSGINAIAHAVEGLYAKDANPVISLLAEDGIRALAQGLPGIVKNPQDLQARTQCQYGAWLCGMVLGSVGMALHHKLCHTLGGSFNLPHAQMHTALLPHALAYNSTHVPEACARIERALGTQNAAQGLFDLAKNNGAEMALSSFGFSEAQIDEALDIALHNPYWNPRPLEREALHQLLSNACIGARPNA